MAMALGDYATAEADARTVQKAFPDSPAGHLLAGRVLAAQKKTGPALAEYDAAAVVAPREAEPVVAALGLLTAQKRLADAAQRVDAWVAKNPQSAVGHQMQGELALARGDVAGAEGQFAQIVAMPGAPASAFKSLAAIKASRNDLAGALAVLAKGEQAWPADASLPAAHAEWLGRAGRIDEAIAIYESMLKRAPDSELAANNLAYVLAERKGDPASLDRALKLVDRFAWSDHAGYVDTLGLVQYRLGRFDQAANVLQRAATLAPGDANVQLHYGMALVKKGDVRQGAEIVRKALAGKAPLADQDEAQALIAST
jgi:tetratricopeptide (TPR) repeat protein